ncbi:hypothetical protein LAZ67_X003778 [Cordylochernes scorpioides]|uniref:Peptidase metallopeptidase domain-containing protein n=1 Tax=Cordylochernes scorpioides TaxID=51811 RepID=A0ABY6LUF0_9ARAC|nr:hypothetical protein LAZ67_X003778 [Cordylochernes scorpioides]
MLTRRWKRSALNNGQAFVSKVIDTQCYESMCTAQDMVTWRLVDDGYTYQLSDANQRSALALAFRMWSEVIPILFLEDTKSPVYDVDILIGFGKDWHLNCPKKFDGRGGTLAHALRRLTATEIHFDDAEILTVNGSGTDLVRLALHEIGHALGLYHSGHNNSAMFPVYQGRFELAWEDRALAQSIYGVCRGSFNTVFDLVRTKPDGKQIYNTFFFRGDHYWLYVNRSNRTRYGDPLQISRYWKGAPSYLDAAVHIFGTTRDLVYLFKVCAGRHFWLYNSTMDQVAAGYPKNISDHFRAIPGSGSRSIPNFLDAVFFDHRDGNLYFFKGNKVYGYDLSRGEEGCCLPGYPRSLSQEFPISKGRRPLPKRLDSVYYSYTDGKMYLMRGSLYWVNIDFDLSSPRRNLVVGPRDIAKRWKDICDVDL